MTSEESLESWLKEVEDRDASTVTFCFPSGQLKNQYFATLDNRTENEVRNLLRSFLISSCSLGCDERALSWLLRHSKKGELPHPAEYHRRLLAYGKSLVARRRPGTLPWEGITWTLDLLPHNPRAAISALDAYFEAHCLVMPDGRMGGLEDAMELIRARYIESPRSADEAIQLLMNESPRTFEHLVERLYSAMGYTTILTPNRKDGGYDVLATKANPGERARLHIECKRWQGNVTEPIIRGLLGVVTDSKATNGVCVTTSDLTGPAKAFVSRNPGLHYINGATLIRLMNEHLGPTWYFQIERLVRESQREHCAFRQPGIN